MKIGIIGSGGVAQTLGQRILEQGHPLWLGTRNPQDLSSEKKFALPLGQWLEQGGKGAQVVDFAEAARQGDLLINATEGNHALNALQLAEADQLDNKVLIDLSNELDFSQGMPPIPQANGRSSLGEKIQAAYPNLKVVKVLNTLNANLMLNPQSLNQGDHTLLMSGNDSEAKALVSDFLKSFGWQDILDLGDITTARGTEMYLSLWLSLWQAIGTPHFQLKVVRES